MEEIYTTEGYPHVSEQLNLKEYFSEYTKCLSETFLTPQTAYQQLAKEDKIRTAMGITSVEIEQLENDLSLSLLDPLNDLNVSPIKRRGRGKEHQDPEKLLLEKATSTLATAVELKAAKSRRLRYAAKLKDIAYLAVPEFEKEKEAETIVCEAPSSIILIARIFKPFHSHVTIPNFVAHPRTVAHEQDIMLHGAQTLNFFRDKITCVNDDVVVGNPGGDETEGSQVPMKQLITSGMFFFGDTFYCDFRDSLNQDYGRFIEEWAKSHPELRIGPFKHAAMEHTRVSDLTIRLGFPYVYIHLGSCEHLITFMEARLVSPTDVQTLESYPLVVNTENKVIYCHACDTYSRSWVVEDDQMPMKPTYLCKKCYDVFYTRNGQRINAPYSCMVPGALESPHAGV